ncbi:MAG TPA: PilZ domain-containing protein [Gemmatimonadales bacterium]
MTFPSEREHYRIQYPTAARPRIVIDGHAYEVIDLSERGVRFRLGDDAKMDVGAEILGQVRFKRTDPVIVTGSVLRIVGKEVAARLDAGVPLKTMIEEQRFLREQHRGMAW